MVNRKIHKTAFIQKGTDSMIPTITQKNVHIFLPYKIAKIAFQIAKTDGIPITKAIEKFYKSKTAKLLEDESTKLWQSGWVGLYRTYKDESDE